MDFAGCYHLELGRWTRLWIFTATPMPNQIPPAAFQLDRSPVGPADPNLLRISPNRIVARKPSQLDGWVLASDGSNTVSITWTDGFTGVSLQLNLRRKRAMTPDALVRLSAMPCRYTSVPRRGAIASHRHPFSSSPSPANVES